MHNEPLRELGINKQKVDLKQVNKKIIKGKDGYTRRGNNKYRFSLNTLY